MAHILIADGASDSQAVVGGWPKVSAGFGWPTCRSCKGHMQYMACIPLSDGMSAAPRGDRALLLFQCQHDPGMCDEWDPNAGGNAALIVDLVGSELVPPGKDLVLADSTPVGFAAYDESEDARVASEQYAQACASNGIGKAGGQPVWVQGDETPVCGCGSTMKFVAQLEEKAADDLNFGGGGCAYAFACAACGKEARLLWQC